MLKIKILLTAQLLRFHLGIDQNCELLLPSKLGHFHGEIVFALACERMLCLLDEVFSLWSGFVAFEPGYGAGEVGEGFDLERLERKNC
jgi:hypothetical protein